MISQNKIAVIAGASYGIGRSISINMARQGYDLILIARNSEKLRRTKDAVNKEGRSALIIPLDISDWESVQKAIKNLISNYGEIDVLINNVAAWSDKTLNDANILEIEKLVDITIKGTMFITKAFVPQFKKQKRGNIINIISLEGWPLISKNSIRTPFATSKYAIFGFSRTLRNELKQDNIKITSIYPGSTSSSIDMNRNFDVDYPHKNYKDISTNNKLSVNDIISAINFSLTVSQFAMVEDIVISPLKDK